MCLIPEAAEAQDLQSAVAEEVVLEVQMDLAAAVVADRVAAAQQAVVEVVQMEVLPVQHH
jgi:hypothetical protein